jgi:hypothetical protein
MRSPGSRRRPIRGLGEPRIVPTAFVTRDFVDDLLREVATIPAVESAGIGSALPPHTPQVEMAIRVVNGPRDETQMMSLVAIQGDFFRLAPCYNHARTWKNEEVDRREHALMDRPGRSRQRDRRRRQHALRIGAADAGQTEFSEAAWYRAARSGARQAHRSGCDD